MAAAQPTLRVSLPSGRVHLAQTRTLVAGGLSSLVTCRELVSAFDEASRTCGAFMYATSRLLLFYATTTLSNGEEFHATGLANENKAWKAAGQIGPPPTVFTQELCEWAINIFMQRTKSSDRDTHPAFERIQDIGQALVAELGTFDNRNLKEVLQSLARSLSVVISNHLNVACASHTAAYLRAKYSDLHLNKKEANQLAKTIGRSVQWNAVRASKQVGGLPYEKLPASRDHEKVVRRSGNEVIVPAMSADGWRAIVATERALLPATWSQLDMLRRRYEMLRDIRALDEPGSPRSAFNLLPVCRSGRVFMKLNTAALVQLCSRAKVKVEKSNVLSIFDAKRLNRLLRRPDQESDVTVKLDLAGEFFRTDGVQAQFVCGIRRGQKRTADGGAVGTAVGDIDDAAVDPSGGTDGNADDDEEDIIDFGCDVPSDIEDLFACDPGKVNLFNVARARVVPAEYRKGNVPMSDGRCIVWDEVYRMSKVQFDEERGTTKRRLQRKAAVKASPAYREAVGIMSRCSLSVVDPVVLKARLEEGCRAYGAIHEFEGSRAVARTRFAAYMGKQKIMGKISRKFESLLGLTGVCAWGGARWAHTQKGRAPCPSAMVYKHLARQPWANGGRRLPREAETNTSCKCSCCLAPAKMVHPHHERVYHCVWTMGNAGRREKTKVEVPGGGRPNGLYQCQTEGCYRTWSRDRNAPANIGRCFWERVHGRPRPATLRSTRNIPDGVPPQGQLRFPAG
jgi:hypothetical protein